MSEVKAVFDGVFGASGKEPGDFGPPIANGHVLLSQNGVLFLRPSRFVEMGGEMVEIALTTLLQTEVNLYINEINRFQKRTFPLRPGMEQAISDHLFSP